MTGWEAQPQLITMIWHDASAQGKATHEHFQLVCAEAFAQRLEGDEP